jgi:hypothetical protein
MGGIETRKTRYIEASNPLGIFINTYYVRDNDWFMRFFDLYNEYKAYLIKNKRRVVKTKEFRAALNNEGLYDDRSRRKVGSEIINGYPKDIIEQNYWIDGLKPFAQKAHKTQCFSTCSPGRGKNQLENSEFCEQSEQKLIFDTKAQAMHKCIFPIKDECCNNFPCNEYEGKWYCEEHFEKAQLDIKEEKVGDD